MSAHELPEDLSRWPDDPFDLLGIPHDVSPRDLRRAYARLIRTYKPEQFPEHFRRIRAAYEFAMRYAVLFDHRPGDPQDTPAPDRETAADAPPQSAESDGSPPEAAPPDNDSSEAASPTGHVAEKWPEIERIGPPARSLPDELDDLWEVACAGNELGAYRGVLDLHTRHPGHSGICMRLYWLLAVMPELDSARTACDWLAAGLRSSGLAGPFRELYRRELADHPEEALSERCAQLLRCPAPPGPLAELTEWRWLALAQLQRGDLIVSDLNRLRSGPLREDEETWVRLLLAALERLAWIQGDDAKALTIQVANEMDQFEHLAIRQSDLWDRRDFIIAVSEGWHYLRPRGPQQLLGLVWVSFTRSWEETQAALIPFIHKVVRNSREALAEFDEVQRLHPVVLGRIGELVRMHHQSRAQSLVESRSPETLATLTYDFLLSRAWPSYAELRSNLLDFCLGKTISPETVALIVADEQDSWTAELSKGIIRDEPLTIVYLAHQVFWS